MPSSKGESDVTGYRNLINPMLIALAAAIPMSLVRAEA